MSSNSKSRLNQFYIKLECRANCNESNTIFSKIGSIIVTNRLLFNVMINYVRL